NRSFISQETKDTSLILIDGMRGKIALKSVRNDSTKAKSEYKITNVEITGKTKKIIGFTCQEAILTLKDGDKTVIWFTPDILPAYRVGQFLNKEIKGVPLEIHSSFANGKVQTKMV